MQTAANAECPVAFLEYFSEQNKSVRRIKLDSLPFRIGRSTEVNLLLPCHEVSKRHSEIDWTGEGFLLRDLGSTNGTFLNGKRINEAELKHDDLVQVSREEFRFLTSADPYFNMSGAPHTKPADKQAVPKSILRGSRYLQEMLDEKSGRILFQPIVDLTTRNVVGYEGLGRALHASLQFNATDLFELADQCGLAIPLSRMFLSMAVEETARLPAPLQYVFLNLHSSEVNTPGLAEELKEIVEQAASMPQIVVELSEKAVVELSTLRRLRQEFHDVGFKVAYDDFGAGQSRFLELTDLPPDFVKLDMGLIRGLHLNESRQNLVQAIARASHDLGVQVIAEGIENRQEADACQRIGCRFGQGFFFGRPQTAGTFNLSKNATRKLTLPRYK